MNLFVTQSAQGEQILFSIVAELAPLRQMMHLHVCRRTAILTPPPISFQHSLAK